MYDELRIVCRLLYEYATIDFFLYGLYILMLSVYHFLTEQFIQASHILTVYPLSKALSSDRKEGIETIKGCISKKAKFM